MGNAPQQERLQPFCARATQLTKILGPPAIAAKQAATYSASRQELAFSIAGISHLFVPYYLNLSSVFTSSYRTSIRHFDHTNIP